MILTPAQSLRAFANSGYIPAKFSVTNISNQTAVVKGVDSTETWNLPRRFTSTGWIYTNGRYDVYIGNECRLSVIKAHGLLHCLKPKYDASIAHYFAVVVSIEGDDPESVLNDPVVSQPLDLHDVANSPSYFLLKNATVEDAVIVVDKSKTWDFPKNTDTPRIHDNGRYDIFIGDSCTSACSVVKAEGIISALNGEGDGAGTIELEIL